VGTHITCVQGHKYCPRRRCNARSQVDSGGPKAPPKYFSSRNSSLICNCFTLRQNTTQIFRARLGTFSQSNHTQSNAAFRGSFQRRGPAVSHAAGGGQNLMLCHSIRNLRVVNINGRNIHKRRRIGSN